MAARTNRLGRIANLAQVLSLPIIVYAFFFAIRIRGIQPPTESQLGEYITAINFVFGASIAYLVYILPSFGMLPHVGRRERGYWFSISVFLLFLSFDEIFMIHEHLAPLLGIREVFIFLAYGAILIALILSGRSKITRPFIVLLGFFIALNLVAVASDTFADEGIVVLAGVTIGYEQICESVGALFLSCAFVSLALRELSGTAGGRGAG